MSDLLLERAAELAAIERALRLARAGRGRRLLICGPPGSGRTALLERARLRAAELGLTVLSADGEPHEREFDFGVARRLLDSDPVLGRRYETLLELGARLAAHAPALVAVDDVQWCDGASLEWLAFCARRLRRTGVALVLAGDAPAEPLAEDAVVLRLRPLGERAVAALLHVELGHAVEAAFARACHAETGGRPLLIHEVAAARRRPPNGALGLVLARRLASLPATARALVPALAVLGDRARLHQAAVLAGLDVDAAAAAADALREAGLLGAGGGLDPPALAEAVYAAIPPARRARLHAAAARFGGSAIHHLLRSEPSADPWVVATLRRRAGQALEDGLPGRAAELLRRAAREGVPESQADVLVALATAERRLADRQEIGRLEAAIDHGAPRAALAGALTRALLAHGRTGEALALPDADDAEVHAGARLQPGAGAAVAARLAAAPGETPALLACRAAEAACAARSADVAVSLAVEALERGLDPESPAYFTACAALAWADRLALARAHLERALEHARRLGSVAGRIRAEAGCAGVALLTGDLKAAVGSASRALHGGPTPLGASARATLVVALVELDRLRDAAAVCGAGTPELRYARGRLRLARCDADGALADFLEVGRELRGDAIEGPALIPWRSAAAFAHAPDALALAEEELALARRFGAPRAIGRALRALAAAGPASERTPRCREAVATLRASEARLEYAHALCDLGAGLRRERARREAREPLREALDVAVRCGAAALVRRAREELAASGARPRRLAQSGRDSLTPAELRVARLAARGLANREIAETLVVTIKTVETELGHAYAKLGIRSRRNLADALRG